MRPKRPKNLDQSLRVALTLLQMTDDQADRNRYGTDTLVAGAIDILDSLVALAGKDAGGAPPLSVTGDTAHLLDRIQHDMSGTTPTKTFYVEHRSQFTH